MLENRSIEKLSKALLFGSFILLLCYAVFLQFLAPTLYGVDGYYHIGVTNFIKQFGFNYSFRWCQFSTFGYSFSDKDLLLHIFTLPFCWLSGDLIFAAKCAVILLDLLFLLTITLILKKYLPNFLIPPFLITIFLSPTFSVYFLYLRPATLASILTILGIYFLIKKQHFIVFFISSLYTLTHISFPMMAVFALICEFIRYEYKKEFFLKNVVFVILGIILGTLIHPNFPYNLLSFYLNGILVPFYSFSGKDIDFGRELYSITTKDAFLQNFMVFFTLGLIFWSALISRVKVSFATLVFLGCSSIYFALSFFSNRFWYLLNPLVVILAASFLRDWWETKKDIETIKRRIRFFLVVWAGISMGAGFYCFDSLLNTVNANISQNTHYENAAKWMKDNVPGGETIYHAYWSDSPYFICFNPKNNYLVALDPIYMYYFSPKTYEIYRDLKNGLIKEEAYSYLKYTFGVTYGYTRKSAGFYTTIKGDNRFKIIYEDEYGVVFKLVSEKKGRVPPVAAD